MELQMKVPMQIAITLITFSLLLPQSLSQVQRQECMTQLQPCLSYLNGDARPPESCCKPLDYIIKSMPECLCSLMTIDGANQAEQAGINATEAQTLPGRCGQRINPLGCVTGTPDRRSRNALPTSFARKLSLPSMAAAVGVVFVALHLL